MRKNPCPARLFISLSACNPVGIVARVGAEVNLHFVGGSLGLLGLGH